MGFAKWGDSALQNGGFSFAGNSLRRETRFAGNSTKAFISILVGKYIICNTRVGELISFCDFFFQKKTMQAVEISKKTPTTRDYFRNCELSLYP